MIDWVDSGVAEDIEWVSGWLLQSRQAPPLVAEALWRFHLKMAMNSWSLALTCCQRWSHISEDPLRMTEFGELHDPLCIRARQSDMLSDNLIIKYSMTSPLVTAYLPLLIIPLIVYTTYRHRYSHLAISTGRY